MNCIQPNRQNGIRIGPDLVADKLANVVRLLLRYMNETRRLLDHVIKYITRLLPHGRNTRKQADHTHRVVAAIGVVGVDEPGKERDVLI